MRRAAWISALLLAGAVAGGCHARERADLLDREIDDLAKIARKAPLTPTQRARLDADVANIHSDVEALR